MTPRRPIEPEAPAWLAATPASPCPCCGGEDGCSARVCGAYVRCLTTVSERPMLGGGWLHTRPVRR
jgi:hypothetical protein